MFSNARFQQGLRRRRWRRLSTSLFGEEKRCNYPGLYQVEHAKREDVVRMQDLKTANMCGTIVDIPPPFRADPHALGTMLFEGGEDDMGTKEEVKPNFRTPPR
jgi:hypothetical protein